MAGGVVAGAALMVAPSPSSAASSYTAVADARLVGLNITTAPGIVFDQLIDAGYAVSQSSLDSLGRSEAFASNPYPSESVVLAPGLVASLSEGATSGVVPEYPLIASSSHPLAPQRRVEAGSAVLEAASQLDRSQAVATDGANRSSATVRFDPSTQEVVARAESVLGTVQVSDALALFGVRSVAEARQRPGGDIERTSTFEVAALGILGQRVAVTAEGLSALDENIPLGLDAPGLLAPLLAALAGQGTTVEVLPARELADGVTSGGLVVRTTFAPPPELASGIEVVTAEATFGAVSASIENRAFEVGGGLGRPDVDVGGGGALDSGASIGGAIGGPIGGSVAPTNGLADVPRKPAAGTVPVAISATSLAVDISVASFYPVLALGAALLVGLVTLFRHLAVRTP